MHVFHLLYACVKTYLTARQPRVSEPYGHVPHTRYANRARRTTLSVTPQTMGCARPDGHQVQRLTIGPPGRARGAVRGCVPVGVRCFRRARFRSASTRAPGRRRGHRCARDRRPCVVCACDDDGDARLGCRRAETSPVRPAASGGPVPQRLPQRDADTTRQAVQRGDSLRDGVLPRCRPEGYLRRTRCTAPRPCSYCAGLPVWHRRRVADVHGSGFVGLWAPARMS